MRRIIVVGSWGAGKSTLARAMGESLGLPVFHLDALFWRAGWQAVPEDEQDRLLAQVLANNPEWIIEGDNPRTQEARIAAADAVLFLDYPRPLCLRRALVRSVRGWGRPRLGGAEGCPERPAWRVVKWIWRYPARRRPELLRRLEAAPAGCTVYVLRSPAEADLFLARLRSAAGAANR